MRATSRGCRGSRRYLVLERLEALGLDAARQLGATVGDDAAVEQHVHASGVRWSRMRW